MDNDFILQPSWSIDAPRMGDYFGLWAVYETPFRALVEKLNGINLHAHMSSQAVKDAATKQRDLGYEVTPDGIALLSVMGPMMKTVSSLSGGTSTLLLRQQIRSARKSEDVLGALLVLDTPGGTVKGNRDVADEVAAFALEKPIYAYTEDMTASAGVSVASQAQKRYANNATALYGAMGTYSVLVDYSGEAEKLGIKVHVIRAGEFKGMGEPGTAITEAQLAEAQRIVNALNDGYLELIARGLGKPVEMIRSLADGRIHTAADALGMGLIDGIQTFDQTYAQLVAATKSQSSQRRKPAMTDKAPAATLAELKAKFPKSTAEWRETQIEASATLEAAAVSYASFVEAAADKREAEFKKQLDEANGKKSIRSGSLGHQPLLERRRQAAARHDDEGDDERHDLNESGDPVEDFNAAVARVAGRNPDYASRQRAIRAVANANPDMYQQYLLATNPGRRQERLILEKLEAVADAN